MSAVTFDQTALVDPLEAQLLQLRVQVSVGALLGRSGSFWVLLLTPDLGGSRRVHSACVRCSRCPACCSSPSRASTCPSPHPSSARSRTGRSRRSSASFAAAISSPTSRSRCTSAEAAAPTADAPTPRRALPSDGLQIAFGCFRLPSDGLQIAFGLGCLRVACGLPAGCLRVACGLPADCLRIACRLPADGFGCLRRLLRILSIVLLRTPPHPPTVLPPPHSHLPPL